MDYLQVVRSIGYNVMVVAINGFICSVLALSKLKSNPMMILFVKNVNELNLPMNHHRHQKHHSQQSRQQQRLRVMDHRQKNARHAPKKKSQPKPFHQMMNEFMRRHQIANCLNEQ